MNNKKVKEIKKRSNGDIFDNPIYKQEQEFMKLYNIIADFNIKDKTDLMKAKKYLSFLRNVRDIKERDIARHEEHIKKLNTDIVALNMNIRYSVKKIELYESKHKNN